MSQLIVIMQVKSGIRQLLSLFETMMLDKSSKLSRGSKRNKLKAKKNSNSTKSACFCVEVFLVRNEQDRTAWLQVASQWTVETTKITQFR